jgi:hypothetical protein
MYSVFAMKAWICMGLALAAAVRSTAMGGEPPVRGRIELELRAPDSAWSLTAECAVVLDERIVALWSLHRPPDRVGAAMITTLRAAMPVDPRGREVLHVVTGKTWQWKNEGENLRFVESFREAESLLRGGRVLWRAENAQAEARGGAQNAR